MADRILFTTPKAVSIEQSRWSLRITIFDSEGEAFEYVASADHGLTFGDGIYFGTKAEYEKDSLS